MSRSDNRNEDWIKTRSLDLWYGDRHPQTLKELAACLPSDMTVEHFMVLPAARALPLSIKMEWTKKQRSSTGPS
jgi:hypothetical protein